MIGHMSLTEVKNVLGGTLFGVDVSFDNISIDTRTLSTNDLFIAISGKNFNGNEFVDKALDKGAVGVISNEKNEKIHSLLKVEDTRIALGKIALMNRDKSNACIVAVTGSQGKTTVKEMVTEVLSGVGSVVATEGNLNNDYGVPLSLLKINEEHEYAVIELGASAKGEIAYTVALTKPKIAHITNVAETHIEGFGSLDGVAKAKAEIWEGVQENGIVVINLDDAYSSKWVEQQSVDKKVITLSATGNINADYFAKNIKCKQNLTSEFMLCTPVGEVQVKLNLPGDHNVANALSAAALSMEAGSNLEKVKSGLERILPIRGRLSSKRGLCNSTIIDDSYNASPVSFRAAIDVLSGLSGVKILAIGDMGELGETAKNEHVEIGKYAKEKGIDKLFVIGPLSCFAAESFGRESSINKSIEELAENISPLLNDQVTVMIKGSRSAGMDTLIKYLISNEE